jgi:hypothetical protein
MSTLTGQAVSLAASPQNRIGRRNRLPHLEE